MFALLIPTGSDHERTRFPVATLCLIGINVLVYLLSSLTDYESLARTFGFVAAHPQPHQFLTHMFLHTGWPGGTDAVWTDYANSILHIGGNMVYLWFAGSDLEDVLGSIRFLVLYLAGGVASALLFWATAVLGHFPNLTDPAVGASGAISALLGLYLVRFPRFKIRLWFAAIVPIPFVMRQGITRVSSLVFIGVWIAVQMALGIEALRSGGAQVAYWGHIGGFLLGLAFGLATQQWRHGQEEFLFKEADHLFYKQKWHAAMELYQRLVDRDARCTEAYIRWALCWECSGMPKRSEKVLRDALAFYQARDWNDETAVIRKELDAMDDTGAPNKMPAPQPAATETEPRPGAANVLFRKNIRWKGKNQ